MTDSSIGTPEQLRDPNYTPPMAKAIPLGIQHVLAMFVSNVTPAIIVCGAAGIGFGSDQGALGFPDMTYMIQMSMLFAGIATLFQTIGFGPVGASLPIVQGTSFAFLPVMIPAVAGHGWLRAWWVDDGCDDRWYLPLFHRYIHRKNPLCAATIGNRPDRFDDWFGADQGWHSICGGRRS